MKEHEFAGRRLCMNSMMEESCIEAFVPHVSQVLTIDDSRGMVEQSNRIAAARKRKFPGWDARALHGDLIGRCSRGQAIDPRITNPNGEYQSFDLVMMRVSHSTLAKPVFPTTDSNTIGCPYT